MPLASSVAAANISLAQASNDLLYAAMILYAGAFVAFAAELAFAGRRATTVGDHRLVEANSPEARLVAAPVPAVSDTPIGATNGAGEGATRAAEPTGTATLLDDAALLGDTATQPTSYEATPPRRGQAGPGDAGRGPGDGQLDHAARVGRVGIALTVVALVAHTAAVLTRGFSVQRFPWGNMFEFSTAASLAMSGVFVALLATGRRVRYLGVFITGIVLLVLGLAVTVLYAEADQLIPALKSVWLGIHVSAAILSMGLFTVGFVQTVLYLLRARYEQRSPADRARSSWLSRLPSAAALDRAAYQMHAFVFPLWTFAIIAGAIWAENAWGRYWGWDPKEVWSFVTWVAYAGYLHARATAGWRGRKAAYLAIAGYATIIFNYFVVNVWLVGFHSYAGVG